ncbi:MAG TPA: hypothetical protein PKC30_07990 [Saprospiraceae bacterium]|nr:hypothetical protein [Saprospiraceae bacterium]
MKIQKVKKQLRKINHLLEAISEEGRYSTIEYDLLKSYIRDLYEKVLEEEEKTEETISVESFDIKGKPRNKKKSKMVEESIFETLLEDPVTEPILEASNAKSSNGHSPVVTPQPADLSLEDSTEYEWDEWSKKIFSEEKSGDLSQKLSRLPIKDLHLAMGLNERIITVHELFKSNFSHFQEVINRLNVLNNFEEAKEFLLSEVVTRYEWNSEMKSEQATEFVKLIRRKYI